MERQERTARVIFTKSGGNASKNAISNRVILPTTWVREMGLTAEDREVTLTFENGEIRIKKKNQ